MSESKKEGNRLKNPMLIHIASHIMKTLAGSLFSLNIRTATTIISPDKIAVM
jgi:hypothetical protein